MNKSEIDEISLAFLEAWEDFFAQEMYYIPFLSSSTGKHSVYNEAKVKQYDEVNKILFHGILRESGLEKELGLIGGKVESGKEGQAEYYVTFVTKELFDKGITVIDTNSIIEYTDLAGNAHRLEIVSIQGKVQLINEKIFTKLGVKIYA